MMTSLLVVDDDRQLAEGLRRDLSRHGFEVVATYSVDGALQQLQQRSFDVVLTDLRLSGATGFELLEQLPQLAPESQAILMSAYASSRDYQRAMTLGAVRVLSKPFEIGELLEAVEQAQDCRDGFRGSVHGLSIVDMLQMFHYARRSISIYVGTPTSGEIHLREGEIIHARQGQYSGEDALRRVLGIASGSVRTEALHAVGQTIHRSFSSLLLDLVRELDEAQADSYGNGAISHTKPNDSELSLFDEAQGGSLNRASWGPTFSEMQVLEEAQLALAGSGLNGDENQVFDPVSGTLTGYSVPSTLGQAQANGSKEHYVDDELSDEIILAPELLNELPSESAMGEGQILPRENNENSVSQFRDGSSGGLNRSSDIDGMRRIEAACKQVIERVEGGVACGVVDLNSGMLLGIHNSSGYTSTLNEVVAAATMDLFRGSHIGRIEQLVRQHRRLEETGEHYFEEVQITSKHNYHFAKVIKEGRAVVMLVTKRTTNIGMGLLELKGAVSTLEPLVP